jgi:AcrR family transcriptional regulator
MKENYISKGRKKQKQKTRQLILKSTQKLIEKGVVFSLEDVAKMAGISRATVYRYFSNVEVLSIEAGLDINTLNSQEVLKNALTGGLSETILNIQAYYNQFGLDNEVSFRTYLSAMLNPGNTVTERGARRVQTLSMAFEEFKVDLPKETMEKVINVATVLMGIEALIVAKDVCGLKDKKAKETLRWGLSQLLKSVL